MSNNQIGNKAANFFEGWYFKHQKGNEFLILIPGICASKGISIEKYGEKYAFIQIITNNNAHYFYYPMSECRINKDKRFIRIGDNTFSRKGVRLNILSDGITLKGCIAYGKLSPIRYPIMGIFQYIPHMECNHGIISMQHNLHGSVQMNGTELSFDDGIGYMEKDWGYSFPKSYTWIQCNSFRESKCAISLSIADIPIGPFRFTGCIGIIHYEGMEYRFATYLGVRILAYNQKEIQLRQGKYLFRIKIGTKQQEVSGSIKPEKDMFYKLLAPDLGSMSRTIYEQNFCKVECQLYEGSRLVFDQVSDTASVEIVR